MSTRASTGAFGGAAKKAVAMAKTHNSWLARVEREKEDKLFQKQAKAKEEARALAQKRKESQKKFQVWSKRKSKYEKALQYLNTISTERAGEDDPWMKVGVAMAAINVAVGCGKTCSCPGICQNRAHSVTRQKAVCRCPRKKCSTCGRCVGGKNDSNCSKGTDADGRPNQKPCDCPLPSLGDAWFEWSRGREGDPRHQFAEVTIAPEVAKTMSEGVQESMEDYARALGRSGEYVLSALTYAPPLKHPARTRFEEIITAQNRILNRMFQRQQRAAWKRAQMTVLEKAAEAVEAALAAFDAPGEDAAAAAAAGGGGGGVGSSQSTSGLSPRERVRVKAEQRVLFTLGLEAFTKMIEEDEIAREDAEAVAKREKETQGSIAYAGFLRKKNATMIRLPPPEEDDGSRRRKKKRWQPPRFDFGGGKKLARPKKDKLARTTFDLMRDSGAKYAYALNVGRQGMDGDLEKSRKQLLKKGYVFKENFKDEDGDIEGDAIRDELSSNKKYLARAEGDSKSADDAAQYAEWSALKEASAAAVRCLRASTSALEAPLIENDGVSVNETATATTGTTARFAYGGEGAATLTTGGDTASARGGGWDSDDSMRSSASASASGNSEQRLERRRREAMWLDVGKALKAVDSRLFGEWAQWSRGYRSNTQCKARWDGFAPVACDLHGVWSGAKDTFLKLVSREGTNFKKGFKAALETKYSRWYRKYEAACLRDGIAENEGLVEERKSNNGLTAREFKRLLEDQGVVMKPQELRRIVKTFDANGDGSISMDEFLAFSGDKIRSKAGAAAAALSRRCVWESACHLCGMSNAYDMVPSNGDDGSTTWRRLELPDHKRLCLREGHRDNPRRGCRGCKAMMRQRRRHKVLMLDAADQDRKDGGGEFEGKGGEDADASVAAQAAPPASCQASDKAAMSAAREHALVFLKQWSSAARAALARAAQVQQGQPPLMPLFTRGLPGQPSGAGGPGMDCDPLTCIELRWRAPAASQPAIFYLLETAGAEAGGSVKEFAEVCKDPPNAGSDMPRPAGRFLVTGLKPNTRYHFRVRAFNGFGPSPPAFGAWATAPPPPPPPLVVRSSVTGNKATVSLAWGMGGHYARKMAELQEMFEETDADGSGQISRAEWRAGIASRPRLRDFLAWAKVASGSPVAFTFDDIEADDDGGLTWAEFSSFFTRTGALFATEGGGSTVDTSAIATISAPENALMKAALGDLPGAGKKGRRRSGSGSGGESKGSSGGGKKGEGNGSSTADKPKYVLLKCLSDAEGVWEPVYTGYESGCTVVGLAPGLSYKFCAQAVNCDGVASANGESVVVNTLLQKPEPPRVVGGGAAAAGGELRGVPAGGSCSGITVKGVCSDRLVLTWASVASQEAKAGGGGGVAGGKAEAWASQLNAWAQGKDKKKGGGSSGAGGLGRMSGMPGYGGGGKVADESSDSDSDVEAAMDGVLAGSGIGDGVGTATVRASFQYYDKDGSGYIDSQELQVLIKDLGGPSDAAAVAAAKKSLDTNGDGQVTYDEFARWWARRDLNYVLKRDGGVRDVAQPVKRRSGRASASSQRGGAGGSRRGSSSASGSTRGGRGAASPAAAASPAPPLPGGGFNVVAFRGKGTRAAVTGLSPNTTYRFRLRTTTRRAASPLSAVFSMSTAPESPEQPVLVSVTDGSARLKWYAGHGGACKFALQLKPVQTLPSSGAGSRGSGGGGSRSGRVYDATDGSAVAGFAGGSIRARKSMGGGGGGGSNSGSVRGSRNGSVRGSRSGRSQRSGGSGVGGGGGGGSRSRGRERVADADGWFTEYEGVDNMAEVTGLLPNTLYRAQLLAMNSRSVVSQPSMPTQFTTAEKGRVPPNTPRTAAALFCIECSGDVVTGDTILFTERVYSGGGGGGAAAGASGGGSLRGSRSRGNGGTGGGGGEFMGERVVSALVERVSKGKGSGGDGNGGRGGGSSTGSRRGGGGGGAAAYGLAGSTTSLGASGGGGGGGALLSRVLNLRVIWSSMSGGGGGGGGGRGGARGASLPSSLSLVPGTVITRTEQQLFVFETMRCAWEQEDYRWGAAEEIRQLKNR